MPFKSINQSDNIINKGGMVCKGALYQKLLKFSIEFLNDIKKKIKIKSIPNFFYTIYSVKSSSNSTPK